MLLWYRMVALREIKVVDCHDYAVLRYEWDCTAYGS